MTRHLPWRRNLLAITSATFIGFTGFTLVMPFLPLYFSHLGVTDVGEIALWTGTSLGVTPALTALLSPLWGRLADRFGRKIMVERSLLSFVVIMAAMAHASRPWHVLGLRVVQGFFAGYGSLALTMAADSAPPGRLASSIGTVQTAQRLGPALGPVIGGALAEIVGLRRAFLVAAGFYAVGFLLVLVAYDERRDAGGAFTAGEDTSSRLTWREILSINGVVRAMIVIFTLQLADRSFGPILPLFVGGSGVELARVPIVSGLLFSIAAGAGAAGNTVCPRLLKRWPAGQLIAMSGAAAATSALVLALRPTLTVIFVATAAFGAAIGTATTAIYTTGGSALPERVRGAGFGLFASASLAGLAVSPIAAGILGALDIRAVFVADAAVMAGVAATMARRAPAAEREPPHVSPGLPLE